MGQPGSHDWGGWLRRRDWRSWLASVPARRTGAPIDRRRRRSWGRAAALLGAALVLLPLGYLGYCIATLPLDGGFGTQPAAPALIVEADDGTAFASRGVFKGDKLSPQDVPTHLARAVIAIEDRHFYEHRGVYLPAVLRAAYRNLSAGSLREGGSTITQQLARISYLSLDRSLKRKVQEAVLAVWLERHLSKEEILTRYLNTAYFGASAYGVDAAAKRYFGKSARDVSLAEAAMLAGLVRAPSLLTPTRNLEGARQRARLVLDAMVETGVVAKDEAEAARREPTTLRVPPDTPPGTNYFVDTLNSEARRAAGAATADLTVRTTLDLELQNIAESVVVYRLNMEGRAKKVDQAALVAMTPDGAIVAMVGGRDYDESQFNRAAQAKRQPGSLFKTFVYLAALENGFNPKSAVVDRPVQVGNWAPENYGGRFRGEVTLQSAFASSINSVAVQLADAVGIRSVIDTARRLGVQSELPPVPSLALGAGEVTLLEMTSAFAAIAADAERVDPYAIRTVRNGDHVLFTRPNSQPAPAANLAARAALREFMAAVVREGTGRAARIKDVVAGKTGTTQQNKDAWFVGFTPELVVGVWVGNDDNMPTNNVTGGDLPARIWHDFVTRALAARAQAARAGPATPGKGGAEGKPAATPAAVRGVATVVDTATLTVQRRTLRLYGVEGTSGRAKADFQQYLGRREIICWPAENGGFHRCEVDGHDLSQVVLFNGGGRASADATTELRAAEQHARTGRMGLWNK
jgi:penicillin-binding protein 1A